MAWNKFKGQDNIVSNNSAQKKYCGGPKMKIPKIRLMALVNALFGVINLK